MDSSLVKPITTLHGLCYKITDSSILQEFFHLSQNPFHVMEEKQNLDEIKRMSSYNSFSYTELAKVYVSVSAMCI